MPSKEILIPSLSILKEHDECSNISSLELVKNIYKITLFTNRERYYYR